MFSSIHFDHFFFHINSDIINNMIRIQTKIQLNIPIPKDISNVAGSDHTVIFNIESIITQTNK